MIDNEQAQHITDVAGDGNRLNEISQPVGYAVTATTSVGDQSPQRFTVHRLDQPVVSGPYHLAVHLKPPPRPHRSRRPTSRWLPQRGSVVGAEACTQAGRRL